jgi:hypothetical protein
LFVDDFLIDRLEGGARQQLQHPQPREIVLTHDRPWEGSTSGYHTFLRDGDRVRVYYRGSQHKHEGGREPHPEVTCTAESPDGLHWRKPDLGLFPFEGSTLNNIVLTGFGAHCLAPFIDDNPACKPGQRYKAVGASPGSAWKRMQASAKAAHLEPVGQGDALYGFTSSDGVRWTRQEPGFITDGAFDSQNIVFWDGLRGEYRAYYRDFCNGIRGIKTATSPDFVTWTPGAWLEYPGLPDEQLYTNQVLPYARAPHLFVGFPSRYVPDRGQIVEGLFMSSRDGTTFHRYGDAFLRPGLNRDRWCNRCNYLWQGLIETASDLPGAPNELSLYSTEHYYEGSANHVRRFTLRLDGFVSIRAPMAGGELLTPPLVFAGERLVLNVSTAAAGGVRVEFQDEAGRPVEGLGADDCDTVWGDTVEHVVSWRGKADVGHLAGEPVRLRFVMNDADLYALQFRSAASLYL